MPPPKGAAPPLAGCAGPVVTPLIQDPTRDPLSKQDPKDLFTLHLGKDVRFSPKYISLHETRDLFHFILTPTIILTQSQTLTHALTVTQTLILTLTLLWQ